MKGKYKKKITLNIYMDICFFFFFKAVYIFSFVFFLNYVFLFFFLLKKNIFLILDLKQWICKFFFAMSISSSAINFLCLSVFFVYLFLQWLLLSMLLSKNNDRWLILLRLAISNFCHSLFFFSFVFCLMFGRRRKKKKKERRRKEKTQFSFGFYGNHWLFELIKSYLNFLWLG